MSSDYALSIVRIFGILNYMIVMDLKNGGNLGSNLLKNYKYNPFEILLGIARSLLTYINVIYSMVIFIVEIQYTFR